MAWSSRDATTCPLEQSLLERVPSGPGRLDLMLERALAFAELVARQAQLLGTQLERAQLPVHVRQLGSLGKRRPAMAELVDRRCRGPVHRAAGPGAEPVPPARLAPLLGIFSCCHLPPVISCRLCQSSRVVSATTIVPGTAPPADRTRPRVRFGPRGEGIGARSRPRLGGGRHEGPRQGRRRPPPSPRPIRTNAPRGSHRAEEPGRDRARRADTAGQDGCARWRRRARPRG